MVLDPNLRVVAATDAYLQATMARRADIVGRHVFEVFPDNPDDPSADAVRNSRASFNRVLQTRLADAMVVQRHDVRKPESEGGGFEVRYWSPVNSPVLNPDGSLAYIIHRVENVTEFVLARQQGVEQATRNEAQGQPAGRTEADLYSRSREVAETSLLLKQANEGLTGDLAKRAGELQAILDAAPVAVWIAHDPQCLRITGNAYADQLVMQTERGGNVSRSALPGDEAVSYRIFRNGVELRPEELPAQIAAATGQPVKEGEFELVFAGGRTVHMLMGAVPLYDAEGGVRGSVAAGVDITGRKLAEAERDRLFDYSLDMLCIVGFDGRFKRVSPSFERILGWKEEEALSRTIYEFIHPDDRKRSMKAAKAHEAGHEAIRFENRYRCRDGSYRWISWNSHPIVEEGLVIAIGRDITERKRAEQVLRGSEERFRALATASSDVVYRMSPDWSEMRHLVGRDFIADTDEPSHHWLQKYIHPDDQPRMMAAIQEAIRTRSVFELEHQVLRVDGSLGWTFSRAIPMLNANGEIVEWFGAASDITARKQAEEQVRRSQTTFSELVERAPFGIYIVDSQFRIAHMNAASQAGAFRNVRPVIGRDFAEAMRILWPEPVAAEIIAAFRHTLETGQPYYSPRFFTPRHDVEAVEGYEWELHRMTLPDGQYGVICYYFDSTKLRQAEAALRESEERFRSVAENMSEGLLVFDAKGNFTYQNPASLRIHGFGTPEAGRVENENLPATWKGWDETGRALSFEEWPISRVLRGERFQDQTLRATRLETGQEFYASYNGCPIVDANGRLAFGFITVREITGQRQAEMAVRESQERFRTLFDTMSEGFSIDEILCDESGKPCDLRYLELNPAFERHTGLKRADIVGRTMLELWPNAEPAWIEIYGKVALDGKPAHFEAQFGPLNRWFEVSAYQTLPGRFATVFFDITERKLAEKAIAGAVQRLNAHMDNSPLAVVEFDPQFRVTRWSTEAEKLFGWRAEEILGRAIAEMRWVHEDDVEIVRQVSQDMLDGKRPRNLSVNRNYRKDGSLVECEWYNSAIYDVDGKLASILSQVLDVTARKRAEEAVRNSRKQLQDIIDGSPGVVFVKDLEGRFITANQTFERFLGVTREELRGKTDYDLITRERAEYYREHDRRVAETGQPIQIEETADLADGRRHVFLANKFPLRDASGKIYAVCSISTDITERKQAEEHLRQTQKLESLGLLAGGVAHDFNNLLVGVIGNASLAQEMLPPDHPAAELLVGVLKTGEQAAHLTRQMLAYSGKGKFLVELLDLSALIPDMSGLVRPSISKKIALHLDLQDDLPPIEADRGQVQQVFMNLVLNAAEAIGSHEGRISVRNGIQTVDERFLRLHLDTPELRPGEYVVLEVRDTGCGMDDATRARIFDPFFSTKFTGRGLGLAAVAGILRGHKGGITVSSAPGKGSCFTVLFPAAARAAAELRVTARIAALQGSGAVLVVDDEEVVRELAKKALERYGYTVLLADSGPAAIDACKRHPGEIALVVLDLSMPHMTGEEVLLELRKIRPEVKVVVSSGYSEDETMALFKGQRVSGFIQKPYTSAGLAEKVKVCAG